MRFCLAILCVLHSFVAARPSYFSSNVQDQSTLRQDIESLGFIDSLLALTAPTFDSNAPTQKIAIIGSGITGAAAAFTLTENARQNTTTRSPAISIFEKHSIIGGRITTTQLFDQAELTIDTCAATFNSLVDRCVIGLAGEVGLTATAVRDLDNGTGVWNGDELVGYVEGTGFRNQGTWSKFKQARFDLRYGTLNDVPRQQIESRYTQTGQLNTFKSLREEVEKNLLNTSLLRSACEVQTGFCNQDTHDLYLREIIEAGVRDRFFGDYDHVNELNSALGLTSASSLVSIDGGNLRLVDRLLKLSGAKLVLNTKINTLTQVTSGAWDVQYVNSGKQVHESFDKVIIAAPLSLADIEISRLSSEIAVPLVDYADTVVTHFTTRRTLSGAFFNVTEPVPQIILTSAIATKAGNKADLPFFSLRLLDNNVSPVDRQRPNPPRNSNGENLYKIVSSKPITDEDIAQYLLQDSEADKNNPVISWIHRENLPRSVPRLDRSLKIQGDIEIMPGLFYAGNGAQVADTVEFGCRMGRNAGRLIIPTPPLRKSPGNG